MANITAKDVAALRERTGVGMMDCKKALVEADGDFEQAVVILREKGLATQAKKAGRVAAEGLVEAFVENGVGVVVEVNSETDFVANTDQFKAFVKTVAKTIAESNPADVEALKACKASGSDMTVQEELQELFLKIRENIQIRRFVRLEGDLVSYVHGEGRIGVLVQLDTDLGDKAYTCGKDCALQIAAMNPSYLDRASVPADVLDGEKKIVMAQMAEDPKMASKPEAVLAKIAEGKLGKYYTENCLLEQEFVKDGEYTVGKYVEKCAKDLGGSIKVSQYVRYERGEGIAKKEENFAEEIASMIK
ncbi:MAG: translation elongation factor Ts [Oscillospiraceae bacterium]|nr:translation elongation factor Ts [Oscillospiraceae bacterium]